MNGRLKGKRFLVTAGADGLGLAIAETYAEEGARVAVCDVRTEALASVQGRHPAWLVLQADVGVESDVEKLFAAVDQAFGGLDGLVNNAGVAGPTAAVESIVPDEWRRCIDVNLLGNFLCTRLAVPRLRQAGGGAIVNLSSSAGRHPFPFRAPYSAAKWAVIGLTRSLAVELGPDNITVNAILPGLVRGARLDAVIAARAGEYGRTFDEQRAAMLDRVAMKRSVEARDIARAALFFASPDGARITGEALGVDAGLISLA